MQYEHKLVGQLTLIMLSLPSWRRTGEKLPECENQCNILISGSHLVNVEIADLISPDSVLYGSTGQNRCSCFSCMLPIAWCCTTIQELKSGHRNYQYRAVKLCQKKNQQ